MSLGSMNWQVGTSISGTCLRTSGDKRRVIRYSKVDWDSAGAPFSAAIPSYFLDIHRNHIDKVAEFSPAKNVAQDKTSSLADV